MALGQQRDDTAARGDVALIDVFDREPRAKVAAGVGGQRLAQGQTAPPDVRLKFGIGGYP